MLASIPTFLNHTTVVLKMKLPWQTLIELMILFPMWWHRDQSAYFISCSRFCSLGTIWQWLNLSWAFGRSTINIQVRKYIISQEILDIQWIERAIWCDNVWREINHCDVWPSKKRKKEKRLFNVKHFFFFKLFSTFCVYAAKLF